MNTAEVLAGARNFITEVRTILSDLPDPKVTKFVVDYSSFSTFSDHELRIELKNGDRLILNVHRMKEGFGK